MLNKNLRIGILLFIAVIVWSIFTSGIGTIEWTLLLSGTILGVLAGMAQGWATHRKKLGEIESIKMIIWWVGALIILIGLKIGMTLLIPSNLLTISNGIYLSILFAISGLFLGRSFVSISKKSSRAE